MGGGAGEQHQPAGTDRRSFATLTGNSVEIDWGPERLADQRWFVADTSKIRSRLAGRPNVGIREGLRALYDWYLEPAGAGRAIRSTGGMMRFALINPAWNFEGSIYFGCREPHLPLEFGYSKGAAGSKPGMRRSQSTANWMI